MRIVNIARGPNDANRTNLGSVPSSSARALMQSATHIITIDGSYRDRLSRLSWAKERWVGARPGRDVIVIKGGAVNSGECWVAVFVEDDKGILSVRGPTAEDALEEALALLEPSRSR
jgi:hypothetical protein